MKFNMRKQGLKITVAFALMAGSIVTVQPLSVLPTALAAGVSLTQQQLQFQKQMYNGLTARKASFQVTYAGNSDELDQNIELAFDDANLQDPYTINTVVNYSWQVESDGITSTATMDVTYRESAAQSAYVHKQVAAALKKIIKPGMNDHLKVKAIHDWVVTKLKYDETEKKFTAYEGLKTGSTVCQGYAMLMYDMLKQAGFEANIVAGYVNDTEDHAWNMVKLDGKWYQIDPTWDDPTPDGGKKFSTDYYLLTNAQLKQDHEWKADDYPKAVTSYDKTLDALVTKGVKGAKELRNSLEGDSEG
ncbi:transglutaminase domain-containing protein [Paenibacillus sp. SGZ-1009]|uniref:transglutaminase domain-containing protein n=1 Tax=Paenibacillus campi TaxID=3106031 RepID=UPI002AFEE0A8|nr:transglutaminase domain-containing protein [Paenibacillus sp. SGZ-1009]